MPVEGAIDGWFEPGATRTAATDRVNGRRKFSIDDVADKFPFDLPETCPKNGSFAELWVFAVSSHLRSIVHEWEIELVMPVAASRIRALNRIVGLVAD